jgi:hypothetical protein
MQIILEGWQIIRDLPTVYLLVVILYVHPLSSDDFSNLKPFDPTTGIGIVVTSQRFAEKWQKCGVRYICLGITRTMRGI